MSFVLDNSVTMRWYFGDGSAQEMAYATRVLEAMKSDEALVPAIWGLEVANVLARAEAKGLTSEARSEAFVGMLHRMEITIDPATAGHALGNTLHLARRFKLSAYDASYLEVALREGVALATLDVVLLKAARKAGVQRFDRT